MHIQTVHHFVEDLPHPKGIFWQVASSVPCDCTWPILLTYVQLGLRHMDRAHRVWLGVNNIK